MKPFALALAGLLAAIIVVRGADLTAAEITKAQQLFITGCADCHRKHHDTLNPKAFSDRAWYQWISRMMPIAKLEDEDAKLLTVYLTAVRAGKAELPKEAAAPDKPPVSGTRK